MKKLFYLLMLLTIVSCQNYEAGFTPQQIAEDLYQSYKFECVNEDLALSTNYYGMGSALTRTTDGGTYKEWEKIHYAYLHNPLSQTDPIDDAWWVLLENNSFYCEINGGTNDARADMPGFNRDDPGGKCVYITKSEQIPNIAWCSNGSVGKHEHYEGENPNPHETYFVHLTDGNYHFVEIHVKDSHGVDIITKVYSTFDYNPVTTYMLCIEDLGGNCLDFNDCVILGGNNMKPRIIYRMAAYPMTITADNQTYSLDGDMYGDYDIELPFNNMNTPSSWSNATIIANSITIPILLNRIDDMPAVIATDITYKFHRDENTMTSSEFKDIPFYK